LVVVSSGRGNRSANNDQSHSGKQRPNAFHYFSSSMTGDWLTVSAMVPDCHPEPEERRGYRRPDAQIFKRCLICF
jgi:hypothetical protein